MVNQESEQLLKKAQSLADAIREIESVDVEESYERTRAKIRKDKRIGFYRTAMKYAAILSIPLLIATVALGWFFIRQANQPERYAEVVSANGSVVRYELPDHSVVWLNSGSKLKYPVAFKGNERNVSLEGEAYFEVQADKKRPFYVHMLDGLKVYVYGTQFNVTAYAEDECIETVLEQGKVNVVSPDDRHVVMQPGERVIYNRKNGDWTKDKVDVYEKVAWKEGKLMFRNATLDEIFKRLSRHFNVDITLNNRYNKVYRYRATFRNETLPQILDYLSQSARMKWQFQGAEQQADHTLSRSKVTVDLY